MSLNIQCNIKIKNQFKYSICRYRDILIILFIIILNSLCYAANKISFNLPKMLNYAVSNDVELQNLNEKKNKLVRKFKLKQREFYPSANIDFTKSISDNSFYDKENKTFSLTYKVFDSNKRKFEKSYINTEIKLCSLEIANKKRNLFFEVRKAYYEIILIDKKLNLVDKNIVEAEKTFSDLNIKLKLKKVVNLDILQQQTYIKELELNKIKLQHSRKKNIELLLQKLFLFKTNKNGENIEFDFNKPINFEYSDLDFDKIYQTALLNNYSYQSISYSLTQNTLSEKIIKSSNRPNITFSGGFSDDDYMSSGYNDNEEWFLKGTVSYNFDSFKFPLMSNILRVDNHDYNVNSNNDYKSYSLSVGINNAGTKLAGLLDNNNSRLLFENQKIILRNSLYNDLLDKFLYNIELKNNYELQLIKIKTQKEIVRKYQVLYKIGKILMNDLIEQKQKLLNEQIELADITIKNTLNIIYIEKISGLKLNL